MKRTWLIDFSSFLLNFKVLSKRLEKLLCSQTVEILHNAVIVNNLEVTLRESDCHEPVIFLLTGMLRIALSLLRTNTCCSSCTMVSVSDIECRDLGKDLSDAVDISLVINHPEMVTETVSCHEIILRLFYDILSNDSVYLIIVRI